MIPAISPRSTIRPASRPSPRRARSLSEKSWPLEKVGSLPHKGSVLRALWRRTRAKLARKWDGRNVACIRLALPRQAPSPDYARTPDPLTLPSPPVGERDQNEESSVARVFSSLSPAAGEGRVRGPYDERVSFMNSPR